MAKRRYTKLEPCPVDDAPVAMGTCEGCRFYRGASSSRHEAPDGVTLRPDGEPFKFPHGWDVCCNWPRDGKYVAEPGAGREHPGVERAIGGGPIPNCFLSVFGAGTGK